LHDKYKPIFKKTANFITKIIKPFRRFLNFR